MKTIMMYLLIVVASVGYGQTLTVKSDAVKLNFVASMQNTKGTIGGFKAKITFNADDLASSSISGTVDASTINTGVEKRDAHLKTSDFFEVEKYPTMSFKSTKIEKTDNGFVMTGLMKIKDVEHEEKITFTFADKVFIGACTIRLYDYKVSNYGEKKPEKTAVEINFNIPVQ